MKKIIFLLLLAVVAVASHGQHSCCNMIAANSNSFADDPAFINAHLSPLPFLFTATRGKMISFKTPDGKDANAFEVQVDQPINNKIFLFHEWWGLNDYIKQEAERLSEATGAIVIAIDLYDGKVTADAEEAGRFLKSMQDDRVYSIISGAIDYAGRESRIQTMGWCLGGKWSLQAALMAGDNVKGCVMYYGMPETDKTKLAKLKCPVLAVFANKDQWITPAVAEQFKKDMEEAGKTLYIYKYDADHAFANPSNPKHQKAAADDAMQKSISFIKNNNK